MSFIRRLHRPTIQQTPVYTVPASTLTFTLWLEFEWWTQEPDDAECDFCNIQVDVSDGRSYALNVWTYAFINRVQQDMRAKGENLSGAYVLPPDLFVHKLERSLIATVMVDLFTHNQIDEDWRIPQAAEDTSADE